MWTSGLLQMLGLLGVTERAARSALSRMTCKKWVKPQREGRRSLYALTAPGKRLLDEGGHRIFEPRQPAWDGQWRMAVYSLPESKRELRNDLRKRLAWLGFGRLAQGTWVSPHDRRAEVLALIDDLDAREYVQYFEGLHLAQGDDQDVVRWCWDLDALNRRYAEFVARWEPEFENCTRALARGEGPTPAECFVQRFWIVHEYSTFPRLDPNLPAALLPRDWLGERAARVFDEYRRLLSEQANEFVEPMLRNPKESAPSFERVEPRVPIMTAA